MAVNLTPNSESRPDSGEGADGLLQKSRLKYNREDREDAERKRIERVTGPLSERRTRESRSGVTPYAKDPRFEAAVERIQQQIRTGRVTLAGVRAENVADEQRLAGWTAVTPRRGTPGYDRFMALKTRVAIRSLALHNELGMMPGASMGIQSEMREIGWTDAARAAAALARRARSIGRKAMKIVTTRRQYSPTEIARTARNLAHIRSERARGVHRRGMNVHGVPLSWKGKATPFDFADFAR